MSEEQPQSLRRLLLTHEIAFVILVMISGTLGATWGYLWQAWSEESIRLNQLNHTAQDIRSLIHKQIQEVSRAGLRNDPEVDDKRSFYTREIQEKFNHLRRTSSHRGEDYAVQEMQTAFSLLQDNLRRTLRDSLALNRLVRSKLLDPTFEQTFVADFEKSHADFVGLINLQLSTQEKSIQRWTDLAPLGLGIPIVIGLGLLVFSRRSLLRGFVRPMQTVVAETQRFSQGHLDITLEEQGVTEVRELAAGINHMMQELETSRASVVTAERQAALGSLVPVVAHNVRNPLASIRASAQLIDAESDAEELSETSSAIMDTVDRLGRWITALVSYLHPLEPRLQSVATSTVMTSIFDLLANRADERGVALIRGDWHDELTINADVDLLEQGLYALVNNAIEASRAGQAVTLSVRKKDEFAVIEVADEAGGIPFRPEPSELTPGPSSKRFGTGLGIPIAFKICAVHNFRLEFDVEEGVGTKVHLYCPLVENEQNDDLG